MVGYLLIAASMLKFEGSLLRMSPATSLTISSVDFAPVPDARDYKQSKVKNEVSL